MSEGDGAAEMEGAGAFAAGAFAPLNRAGDEIGAKWSPEGVTLPPGFKEIVAYLVGPDAFIPEVAEYLAGYLSHYLLPAVYVKLDALPLTPSGKLDRQALPVPTIRDREARTSVSEVISLIEADVAEVRCDLLQVNQLGRNQNFFSVGGTSLSALQMLHRIKTRFGVAITVRQFFDAPTIAGVAAYLETALAAEVATLSDAMDALEAVREGRQPVGC